MESYISSRSDSHCAFLEWKKKQTGAVRAEERECAVSDGRRFKGQAARGHTLRSMHPFPLVAASSAAALYRGVLKLGSFTLPCFSGQVKWFEEIYWKMEHLLLCHIKWLCCVLQGSLFYCITSGLLQPSRLTSPVDTGKICASLHTVFII